MERKIKICIAIVTITLNSCITIKSSPGFHIGNCRFSNFTTTNDTFEVYQCKKGYCNRTDTFWFKNKNFHIDESMRNYSHKR